VYFNFTQTHRKEKSIMIYIEQNMDGLKSNYLIAFVTIVSLIFACLVRPPLPSGLVRLFDSPLTKIIFYTLVALIATQNLQVALVVAIAFYVIMSVMRQQQIGEGFIDGLTEEGFFDGTDAGEDA
jgi:hypothetical protein